MTVFHDLQHKRHPEYFRWFDRPFWRLFLYWAARRSQALIAISGATATDLRRFYPRLPASKIYTVPQGVDPAFAEIRPQRHPEPFLLTVATLHPHKNLNGLLRAFAFIRLGAIPNSGWWFAACTGSLPVRCMSCGCRSGWRMRSNFRAGFRASKCTIFSRARGRSSYSLTLSKVSGLPVLEAMAAGVPMACSNVEPMAGLAGDAALLFDPEDVDAMAAAMLRITEDEALRAGETGGGWSTAGGEVFWEATAKGTLEAMVEVGT